MLENYMFNEVSSEELYEIDGGSTKAAAVALIVVSAACTAGSYVASKAGNSQLSSALGAVGSVSSSIAAWAACAPFI